MTEAGESTSSAEFRPLASTPQAVVHLGASSASMLVYQLDDQGAITRLEFMEQPLPIAWDIFRHGHFLTSTLELAVSALRQFQEVLREYGVPDAEPERVVATNIIAEARNADVFLNRLHVGCGLDVEPLDDGEMTRLIYMETQRLLNLSPELAKGRTLVVHAGPGNTRVVLLKNGKIAQYGNYRLGTHRMGQSEATDELQGDQLIQFTRQGVRSRLETIEADYEGHKVDRLLSLGYELQMMRSQLLENNGTPDELRMSRSTLKREANTLAALSADERVRRYLADDYAVDALIPAALIHAQVAQAFDIKDIYIPETEYEAELVAHLPYSAEVTESFAHEVRQSALSLARRYKVDIDHALQVEDSCVQLFEILQPLHQLDARHLLLLRVAAITHEVGNFITPKAHHKHSMYIIANSEIFGLSQTDTEFVATVARYHRHSPPKAAHEYYADMDRRRRLSVSKLAAILRVADSLDRAHSNRFRSLRLELGKRQLRVHTEDLADISIEQQALEEKGDFFGNVYGLDVVLVAST